MFVWDQPLFADLCESLVARFEGDGGWEKNKAQPEAVDDRMRVLYYQQDDVTFDVPISESMAHELVWGFWLK